MSGPGLRRPHTDAAARGKQKANRRKSIGFLLGGSIVVEKVFNWPGLGRLLVDSVEMRDYPVIQAEVLLFSLEFILINLVVDVLYAAINPAIRYK